MEKTVSSRKILAWIIVQISCSLWAAVVALFFGWILYALLNFMRLENAEPLSILCFLLVFIFVFRENHFEIKHAVYKHLFD